MPCDPKTCDEKNPLKHTESHEQDADGCHPVPMVSFPMKYWNALLEAAGLAPGVGLHSLIEHVRKLRERAHFATTWDGQWPTALAEVASLLGLAADTRTTVGDVLEKIRQLQLVNSRGQWTYFRDAVTKALRAVPQGTHEPLEDYADRLVHVIDELRNCKYSSHVAPSPSELESVGMCADSTPRDLFNELRAVKNRITTTITPEDLGLPDTASDTEVRQTIRRLCGQNKELQSLVTSLGVTIKSFEEDWQRVTNLLKLGRDAGCREVLEKIRGVATGLRGVTAEELEMLGLREGTSYRELFDEVKRLKTVEIPKYLEDLRKLQGGEIEGGTLLGYELHIWHECRDTLREATAISHPANAARALVARHREFKLLDDELRKFHREVLHTQDETSLETLRNLIEARSILWSVRSAVGLPIGADFTEVLPRVTEFVSKVRELTGDAELENLRKFEADVMKLIDVDLGTMSRERVIINLASKISQSAEAVLLEALQMFRIKTYRLVGHELQDTIAGDKPINDDYIIGKLIKELHEKRDALERLKSQGLTIDRAQELVGLLMVETHRDQLEPNYFRWKLQEAIDQECLGDALLTFFEGCQRDGTKLSEELRDAFHAAAVNAESKLVIP